MGKSSPKAPAAPDPVATSQAQTASNKETASWQAALNNVNQTTPWGNLTYSQIPGGGRRYDDAGYQKAMDDYNSQLATYNNSGGGVDTGNGTKVGLDGGAGGRGAAPIAPDKEKYFLGDSPERWQLNMELSPEQQAIYDSQVKQDQQISNIASGYMDRIGGVMGQPFSLSGLPGRVDSVSPQGVSNSQNLQYGLNFNNSPQLPGVGDFSGDADKVREALYQKQTSMLDPQYETQKNQMDAKLANQGIMPGSAAYQNAVDDYGRTKSFDYDNARTSAILAGGNEQSRLFGLGMQARQQDVGEKTTQGQFRNAAIGQNFGQDLQASGQNFNQSLAAAQFANQTRQNALQEALTERQLPLNEFNALRSASQITAPQFNNTSQTPVRGTDVMGAYNNQYQGQMNQYNSQLANQNNMMGGLFGLGASAITKWSDKRLKKNIRKIGKTKDGLNLYKYKYLGDDKEQVGVMAQEVEKVMPAAVITFMNGFKAVNYGMIY